MRYFKIQVIVAAELASARSYERTLLWAETSSAATILLGGDHDSHYRTDGHFIAAKKR